MCRLPYILIGVLLGTGNLPGLTGTSTAKGQPASTRIVHRFDFDERQAGNLEDLPKYWTPIRPGGFPRYAQGAFKFDTGRAAPPSFYLASSGRSVVYHYSGPDTAVRTNSEYRIEGYIRPHRLRYARACLSAHFLDRFGQPLAGSLARSRYVGGPDEPDEWIHVELFLPAAPPEARTLGLNTWVLQETTWNTARPERRHIPRKDVHGGAWFDDITIYALPRAELTTSEPGNVLAPSSTQELNVILADDEEAGIEGRLSITDADGLLVETHQVSAVTRGPVIPATFPLGHLGPGLYHAELDVFASAQLISTRRVTFVRLAPLYRETQANARPFGVVVDPQSRSEPANELALLRNQVVRSVKLPVWTGLPQEPQTVIERRVRERLLQVLAKDGFALTGVLFGPPSEIVLADGPYPRSLVTLLSGTPSAWQEHLAAVVAPHASIFRWWQIGRDGVIPNEDDETLVRAAKQLDEAMHRFITAPLLTIPASTNVEPPAGRLPVQQISLAIRSEIVPEWIGSQVGRFGDLGYEHLCTFIEPAAGGQFSRLPRLADWAQRIISARHARARVVFVPQTWQVRETAQGKVTEPVEEYIVLRTIADVVSDAVPGQSIYVAAGVRCLAFHDGDSTVLAMWDRAAPPGGSDHAIQLGSADRQIDLWGNPTPLERDEHGRQIVHLSATPVLVDNVDRSLIDLRTAMSVTPNWIESGTELVKHTLEITNPRPRPISGVLTLEVPESWEVTPRMQGFRLMPQRSALLRVEVHYSHNEPAGVRPIIAKMTLPEDSLYLEVPLPVELGLKDVDVRGMATIEGRNLVLRHVVTNRSGETLHFRGIANVPGWERQYRPLSSLQPGGTQTVEYRFAQGAKLTGSKVRLELREMNDGPKMHTLELVVP
ncbi:MAG: hypothetical protein JSU63_20850 [Phycisphaerales bacterium]|nr:MAG: hypothetical protein JSU63_20850 [Phycisphaerales bacterium]